MGKLSNIYLWNLRFCYKHNKIVFPLQVFEDYITKIFRSFCRCCCIFIFYIISQIE